MLQFNLGITLFNVQYENWIFFLLKIPFNSVLKDEFKPVLDDKNRENELVKLNIQY